MTNPPGMDIEALHAYADHLAANMPPITDEQAEMAARILATVISERPSDGA